MFWGGMRSANNEILHVVTVRAIDNDLYYICTRNLNKKLGHNATYSMCHVPCAAYDVPFGHLPICHLLIPHLLIFYVRFPHLLFCPVAICPCAMCHVPCAFCLCANCHLPLAICLLAHLPRAACNLPCAIYFLFSISQIVYLKE